MIQVKERAIKQMLFDLDETLYPKTSGLMAALSERINQYMEQRLGLSPEEVKALRQKYYQSYSTTSRGLYLNNWIDLDDYLAYVHNIPVKSFIQPDPDLDQMLGRLSCPKSIFTNSPDFHVHRVLSALGVEQHFSRIFDIYALDRIHKPERRAYERALHLLSAVGEECLLADDQVRNLLPGKELGMITVLVGDTPDLEPEIDFVTPDIHRLGEVIAG